jgi:hypothetical protein
MDVEGQVQQQRMNRGAKECHAPLYHCLEVLLATDTVLASFTI